MTKVIIVNNGNPNEEEFCVVALFITRKYKRKKNQMEINGGKIYFLNYCNEWLIN